MARQLNEESVAVELNRLIDATQTDIERLRDEIADALKDSGGKSVGVPITRSALRLSNLEGRLDLYKIVEYRLYDHAHRDTPYDDRQRRAYTLLVNRLAQTPTEDLVNHAAQAHQEGFRLAFRDVHTWLEVD